MFSKSRISTLLLTLLILGTSLPWDTFTFAATYKCDTEEEKRKCQQLLDQTQDEINQLSGQLDSVKQTGASLERDKQILALKIKQAQLEIKARELSIANIGKDIVQKTKIIQQLDSKIDTGRESLSQIIRKTNQADDYSLPEIILGAEDLSDAFADLDAFDSIKLSLASTFTELRDNIKVNEEAKITLDKKKNQEIDTKSVIESEKRKVEIANAEKQRLLNLNKNEQSGYQKIIADKASEIAKIKSALFGLRDSEAIPFEDAYKYAKNASKVTGVRPAFVLAIITQESELGKNVGTCNRPQDIKKWDDILPGPEERQTYINNGGTCKNAQSSCSYRDDQTAFKNITNSLGIDPNSVPLSCPILSAGPWGGAMGPAQFIPSTWMLIKNRVASILKISTPDPWNPEHAITASSIYLSDLGAISSSFTKEITAACKYYGPGGASCTYGKQVMAKVATLQTNIDLIEGN